MLGALAAAAVEFSGRTASAADAAPAEPPAVPVSVAAVERRDVIRWA